jgi:1-phosphatidylinositol phosphodiesterase
VALLAPTTSVEDVFFGFYSWLSKHPTETLLISMKYESGPRRENNEAIQKKLYDIFNSKVAKKFWLQSRGYVRFPSLALSVIG